MNDGARSWRIATRAAVIVLLAICGLRGALLETGIIDPIEFVLGAVTGGLVLLVAWWTLRALAHLFRIMPAVEAPLILAIIATLVVFDQWSMSELWRLVRAPSAWGWPLPPLHGLTVPALATVVLAGALVAVVVARSRHDAMALAFAPRGLALTTLTAAALVAAVAVATSLADDGRDPFATTFRTLGPDVPNEIRASTAGDPALTGPEAFERLTYGAGVNARRRAFGRDRDLTSRTVDGSALLPEWDGLRGEIRRRYWGFDLREAPLNAIVWAPTGIGPFPLVLVVHGNHSMIDVSDPGYAYLGELLASRGFIVASVDENFINGSWSGDFRGREMAMRAWLLLEHLALWRDWNDTPGHRFAGRVDMDRIALVGHSRGGEAVSIAEAFDALPHHPDDATIPFDYDFDIDALVAIAQVDQRYHRRVEIEDVSFLALQGSYDADEPAFHGLRQFNRIELSEESTHFKAGLYIHGANHGQFNEGWGRKDYGPPGAWLLNLAPIIDGEAQRRIAAVSISAFLEATLHGDDRYRAFFRDPRRGAAWLPEGTYLHQYTDASFVPIADYEEDLDVTTASAIGARIRADDLALWREEALEHRDGRPQGSAAAVIGWRAGTAPIYEIALPAGLPDPTSAGSGAAILTFAIAPSPERARESDEVEQARASETITDDGEGAPADADPREAPLTFEIEFLDVAGNSTRVGSSAFARIAPPLRVQYLKSAALNRARYDALWEAVLQTVEIPLAETGATPESIRAIRLHFDGSQAGTVLLDTIGLRRVPNPVH